MLKKLRKTLSKEFKKRYEQMESRYLGLENRIYTTIEERLATLENKFEELSELIRDEIHSRKERNEDKLEEIALDADHDEDGDTLTEKIEDVKEAIEAKIKEAKETVSEKAEEVSEKVKVAKKIVTKKLKKGKKKAKKEAKEAKEVVETVVEQAQDDLTAIKGLGVKMAEKLTAEGVTSFAQLAKLNKKEIAAMDEKIKSFAARFERYEWGKQAKELK